MKTRILRLTYFNQIIDKATTETGEAKTQDGQTGSRAKDQGQGQKTG